MLLTKVLRKMLVKDACLEKFNQCLITNGYLRAKVVPDDNGEFVPSKKTSFPGSVVESSWSCRLGIAQSPSQ